MRAAAWLTRLFLQSAADARRGVTLLRPAQTLALSKATTTNHECDLTNRPVRLRSRVGRSMMRSCPATPTMEVRTLNLAALNPAARAGMYGRRRIRQFGLVFSLSSVKKVHARQPLLPKPSRRRAIQYTKSTALPILVAILWQYRLFYCTSRSATVGK